MKKAALVLVVLSAASASAQNWPSFRGPEASGLASGAAPLKWNAAKMQNVAWKTPIPGLGHSSPVVWGDRIYLTTAVARQGQSSVDAKNSNNKVVFADDLVAHQWHVYAIDRRTGKVVWDRVAHEGVPRAKRHVKSSYANATPATDGRYVVALMGAEGLFCYDTAGKLLWKKVLDLNDPKDVFDQTSSPVLYRDKVILQNDRNKGSFLAAYDLKTGAQAWRVERNEDHSWSTPTVFRARPGKQESDLLVTHSGKFIRGIDPANGKELWSMAQNDPEPWDRIPAPVAAGDLIIITGGNGVRPVFAIRRSARGNITLKPGERANNGIAWSTERGAAYMPTPIVVDDIAYVLRENGVLSAYRAATGEALYQQRLSPTGGYFSPSPVAARGHLYFTNDDGDTFIIRAGAKYEVVGQNSMGELTLATPAIAGDSLYVRTRSHLYGIVERH